MKPSGDLASMTPAEARAWNEQTARSIRRWDTVAFVVGLLLAPFWLRRYLREGPRW